MLCLAPCFQNILDVRHKIELFSVLNTALHKPGSSCGGYSVKNNGVHLLQPLKKQDVGDLLRFPQNNVKQMAVFPQQALSEHFHLIQCLDLSVDNQRRVWRNVCHKITLGRQRNDRRTRQLNGHDQRPRQYVNHLIIDQAAEHIQQKIRKTE